MLSALSAAAVFRLGGVVVGTQAFVVLGNLLEVAWEHGLLRTQDVDIPAARVLAVAVPGLTTDVPGVLQSLEMGFLPVPGLSPISPSTSFKVRGRALRVDLLTPAVGRARGPVPISRFKAAAEPLPFLDYLLAESQPAAVIDGGGILVQIPHPARFALHKLLVAPRRPAAMQTKSDKDLRQAGQLIELLARDRPGDLALARRAIVKRGGSWLTALSRGTASLRRRAPAAARTLDDLAT